MGFIANVRASWLVARAQRLLLQERAQEAWPLCQRAINLAPRSASAWQLGIVALLKLHRDAEALQTCDFALTTVPPTHALLRLRALSLMRVRRAEEAVAVFDYILSQPFANVVDVDSRGLALYRAGRYAEATLAHRAALAQGPANYVALNNLGCDYFRLQFYERALAVFQQARAQGKRRIPAAINVGEALMYLGRLDEAWEPLSRADALRQAGVDRDHWLYSPMLAGFLHTRQGRLDAALVAFTEALRINPEHAETLIGYAEWLLARGVLDQAAATIERSLALDPHDARAWSTKSRILSATGDTRGADEALAYGQRMLDEQRVMLATWERAQPGWPPGL